MTQHQEDPTPLDVLVALGLIVGVFLLAMFCARSRAHAEPAPRPTPRPVVQVYVDGRSRHDDVTTLHLRAQLRGEPSTYDEWLCLYADWWREAPSHAESPIARYECGEQTQTRHFYQDMDVYGQGWRTVGVTVWGHDGKVVATGSRPVAVVAVR